MFRFSSPFLHNTPIFFFTRLLQLLMTLTVNHLQSTGKKLQDTGTRGFTYIPVVTQ